jgi:hypothetical protein
MIGRLLPVLGALCLSHIGTAQELKLSLAGGVPILASAGQAGHLLILERSVDLFRWQEAARVLERLHPYADGDPAEHANGFYRLGFRPLQAEDDWSDQLAPAGGELFSPVSGGLAAIRFAKFSMVLDQPTRVFFQDSAKWPYHYHFARARLPGYALMSILDYNAQALYANARQRMVVGAVLRAPDPQVREVGIEITGAEPFPVAQTVDWVEAVMRRLVLEDGWRAFYLPSVEQQDAAEAGRALFEARGIALDSLSRWVNVSTCYSPGWALGRLVFVTGSQIAAALGDGRLGFGDILVTDRLPAELPVLAGYLTLEPATPNSHVALLARSLLLPLAYANGAGLQAEIASLNLKEVLLVVDALDGTCRLSLVDTTGLLTPERRREILASKAGGPLDITPKAPAGAVSLLVDSLTPADIGHVGGKAANFGFLRRSLPFDSPSPAIAFTFDLWDAYQAQTLPGGQKLRDLIQARLGSHTYPPNVNVLRADLAAVKGMITEVADFDPAQRAAIVAALQQAGFGGRKIRFRSSTNVEDTESYSGAGLYDSYSGCLEDDLDGDNAGPSRCDPTESKERGVFRAMRKVYASFYNENAFLERLRHGLDETRVGMALLVHYSTPDEFEMANGVATLAVDKSPDRRQVSARLVTQLGAESVTNPDPTKRPEVVVATYSGSETAAAELRVEQASSLTVEGDRVMPWESAYRVLLDRINEAALAYETYYPARSACELDFEFKRVTPGIIGLKQIRAVPHPFPVPPPTIP